MGTVQEVRIAKRTGFCYGVREAIDKAKEASAAGKPTHTLGQVVHNEGVVRDLQDLGIETVDTLDDVDHGAAVVIRAHGVRPDVMERANARGLEVIDGTCTWVIQEQQELRKLVEEGYTIVLLGTPQAPRGRRPARLRAGRDRRRRGGGVGAAIPRKKRMALISQSTQPPWKFEKLAAFMVSRAHELKIVNTVCPVTIRRQQDTLEAAGEVDLMVVVGGRSSANTKELTRLCEIAGTPRDPDRERRATSTDPRVVRRRARSSASPAARRRRSRTCATSPSGSSSSPGRPRPAPTPPSSPSAALARAATPAGRTTSLPTHGAAGRPRPARPEPVASASEAASRSSPSSAGRTSARARSSTGSSASARRSSRTAPGRRATGCTATPSGTAGASSSSTPAASRSTRTTRSRRRSRSRPASRSPRPTSSCSSSTPIDRPDAGRPGGGASSCGARRRR